MRNLLVVLVLGLALLLFVGFGHDVVFCYLPFDRASARFDEAMRRDDRDGMRVAYREGCEALNRSWVRPKEDCDR